MEQGAGHYLTREHWRSQAAVVVIVLAGGRARAAIIVLATLFALWQGYIFMWLPLRAQAQLPAGLAPVQPKIDVEALAEIQAARAQRLQHAPNTFAEADRYFRIPSPSPRP